MLIAAPRFDDVTAYSYKWAVQLAQDLGGQQTLLLEQDATRENFEKEIGNHNLFVFEDHGDKQGLIQQGGQGYMVDKSNDSLLKGKEVYTMACEWASDGGIDAWKKGATAVWGYTQVFGFTTDEEGLFCEAANYGLLAKVREGLTWKDALERAKQKFDELIVKAKDAWSKIWLTHDRDSLVCYTEETPPNTSTCPFRKAALKLFGSKLGWKLSWTFGWGILCYLLGTGVALHDFAHETWELKGTALSLEGGYIGFAFCILGFILLVSDHIRWLRR